MPIVQKQLAEVLTVARASAGTVFDAAGNLTTVAANLPRFDYDPISKAFRGLLVEEQRTNRLRNSDDFQSSNWVKNGSMPLAVVGVGEFEFRRDSTTVAQYLSAAIGALASGVPLTFSFDVQRVSGSSLLGVRLQGVYPERVDVVINAADGSVAFQGVNGPFVINSIRSQPMPGGYFRVQITATPTAAYGAGVLLFGPAMSAGNGWDVVGAVDGVFRARRPQLEDGAFATSYIPTGAAAATRAADVVQVIDGLWRGNSAHTLYVEASRPQVAAGTFAALRSAGHLMSLETGSSVPATQRLLVTASNAQQALLSTPASAVAGQVYRLAGTLSAGRAAFAQDGQLVGSQAGIVLPVLQSLVIGSGGTSSFLNGHIRNVQYVDRVLSDADLIAVSLKGLAA